MTTGTIKSDLLQGTLDMLILQVVAAGPVHGYAIAQRLQQQLEKTHPATNQRVGATVISAREPTVGAIRPGLLVPLAGVGLVFAGVPLVLFVIAMIAAAVPAMRAAHVDPVQALRKA